MKATKQYEGQHGAVSLFVVVFTTLLMIVITISFIQLMLKDQQQATASDLSQSAYDSAQAGVEDAKRLLLLDQSCRNNTAPAGVDCDAIRAAVESNECNTVATGLFEKLPEDNPEVMVQQDEAVDSVLQQAYTCVKIDATTSDYRGIVGVNESNIIPLKGVEDFDSVRISWFMREDISAVTNSLVIGFPSGSGPQVDLPRAGEQWQANYPALLRTQLMQTGGSFKLSDANDSSEPGKSNANTLFLYPASPGNANMDFALDAPRKTQSNIPRKAGCVNSFSLDTYACTVTIKLPEPISGNASNRNAFLRLSALYNGAHYKVQLYKSGPGEVVEFDRVQPEVDSTGRANDMFRRVKSRIEFKSDFIYPEAAVDIEGDLCKSFIITDLDSEYEDSSTCKP